VARCESLRSDSRGIEHFLNDWVVLRGAEGQSRYLTIPPCGAPPGGYSVESLSSCPERCVFIGAVAWSPQRHGGSRLHRVRGLTGQRLYRLVGRCSRQRCLPTLTAVLQLLNHLLWAGPANANLASRAPCQGAPWDAEANS
jgi:hypothetical protein